jgi:hypothetical protein
MGKFSRSWELTKQSGRVLMADKQLLILPILSSIACLLVLASFAVPIALSIDWSHVGDHAARSQNGRLAVQPWYYPVLFLYYFANFFVITFFNSALIACAIRKFAGESATLKDGLSVACARLPQIAAWSLVAATVGMILRAIEERAGFIGRIVIGLIGMAWTIATFFVVPVLVVEKTGPITAIKRSAEILKKTWGESLIANAGIGLIMFLLVLVGIIVLVGGGAAAIALQSPWPIIIVGVAFVFYLLTLSLVSATLKGILLAATYQYAATGVVPGGFDETTLTSAFRLKEAK